MKFTKSIVLAALIGTMTLSDVQSIHLHHKAKQTHKAKVEPGTIAHQVMAQEEKSAP